MLGGEFYEGQHVSALFFQEVVVFRNLKIVNAHPSCYRHTPPTDLSSVKKE